MLLNATLHHDSAAALVPLDGWRTTVCVQFSVCAQMRPNYDIKIFGALLNLYVAKCCSHSQSVISNPSGDHK